MGKKKKSDDKIKIIVGAVIVVALLGALLVIFNQESEEEHVALAGEAFMQKLAKGEVADAGGCVCSACTLVEVPRIGKILDKNFQQASADEVGELEKELLSQQEEFKKNDFKSFGKSFQGKNFAGKATFNEWVTKGKLQVCLPSSCVCGETAGTVAKDCVGEECPDATDRFVPGVTVGNVGVIGDPDAEIKKEVEKCTSEIEHLGNLPGWEAFAPSIARGREAKNTDYANLQLTRTVYSISEDSYEQFGTWIPLEGVAYLYTPTANDFPAGESWAIQRWDVGGCQAASGIAIGGYLASTEIMENHPWFHLKPLSGPGYYIYTIGVNNALTHPKTKSYVVEVTE